MELGKPSVFVVFVKRMEVDIELFVRKQVERLFVKGAVFKPVERKYVRQLRDGFQAHVDVVPKQEFVTDGHDVPSRTIVLGRDSLLRNQFGWDGTKNRSTFIVQLL